MSKFNTLKVNARATIALAQAKASKVKDEMSIAKQETEREFRIQQVKKAQEARDAEVIRICEEIDNVSDAINKLEIKRAELFDALTKAEELANDTTTLTQVV